MPASATTYLLSWWLLLSCAGCTSLPPTAASAFKKGNEQLARGDYARAIGTYHELERQGVRRAELYCNTGNAFYKAGQVGWAVYYYEKGLALAPFDRQLRANKVAALGQAQALVPEEAAYKLSWAIAPKAADGVAKLAVASILLSSILFLGSALGGAKPAAAKLLRPCRHLLRAGGGLLLVAGGLLLPARPESIVVQAKTTGRAGPGQAARKVFEAEAGEAVTVQSRYQDWLKVQTLSGEEGWVSASSVASLAR